MLTTRRSPGRALAAASESKMLGVVLCPGRTPPTSAVRRPACPHKRAIQNRFAMGNAKEHFGRLTAPGRARTLPSSMSRINVELQPAMGLVDRPGPGRASSFVTETDSTDSKISVRIPKAWRQMAGVDSAEWPCRRGRGRAAAGPEGPEEVVRRGEARDGAVHVVEDGEVLGDGLLDGELAARKV